MDGEAFLHTVYSGLIIYLSSLMLFILSNYEKTKILGTMFYYLACPIFELALLELFQRFQIYLALL